jgi:hypothetical protein
MNPRLELRACARGYPDGPPKARLRSSGEATDRRSFVVSTGVCDRDTARATLLADRTSCFAGIFLGPGLFRPAQCCPIARDPTC